MKEEFNFDEIKNKALEQLKSGKSLLGKDGAFAPLLESILNAALEGKMDAHMDEAERSKGNRRNGYMTKQVQTPLGEVTVHTPRDRESTFEPEFIKKRERILADGVADRITGLYALGNSTREISDWMEENLGNRVSANTISSITDRVLPEIQAWRSRPLENVYAIVWMDAIHYKVMDEKNRPVTRAIYNIIGITPDGYKDLLGMYISKSESANFWLSCLTDMLFKQMKQNFPLKYFYGESANAIKIQIWITLIANLLLMVMQKNLTRHWSFSGLATMVRITLMYYVDFYSLFNNPEKDWKTYLKEVADSPPEPTLFDRGGLSCKK